MALDKVKDHRIGCLSLMTSMPIGEFIEIAERAYENQGGLSGQRPALKTKTALTIRQRMVDDLRRGAVVPPVVIGVQCLDSAALQRIEKIERAELLLEELKALPAESLSIIDGMQRTTAFLEAATADPKLANESIQRFEFWISDNVGSLIYRMLVLNTGQVPWEISRQLETIYSQFLQKLKIALGDNIEIFSRDDERRRRDAGQFQASTIIRLFLTFASRRMEFDLRDKVAEDFARIDTVEASSHSEFFDLFIDALHLLVSFDREFSRGSRSADNAVADVPGRIETGKALFMSYPALVGFIAAIAVAVMDEPGFPVDWNSAPDKMGEMKAAAQALIGRISAMPSSEVDEFLSLDTLNQRLSVKTGQVGRFEREVFFKAFSSMFRNAHRLEHMEPCWLA